MNNQSETTFADEAARLLAELGDTPEAIAGSLAKQGVRGMRGKEEWCVLACYLRDQALPIDAVSTGFVHFDTLYDGDTDEPYVPEAAPTSAAVDGFMDRFDAGEWPDLVGDPR